jgi:hypothetical protein
MFPRTAPRVAIMAPLRTIRHAGEPSQHALYDRGAQGEAPSGHSPGVGDWMTTSSRPVLPSLQTYRPTNIRLDDTHRGSGRLGQLGGLGGLGEVLRCVSTSVLFADAPRPDTGSGHGGSRLRAWCINPIACQPFGGVGAFVGTLEIAQPGAGRTKPYIQSNGCTHGGSPVRSQEPGHTGTSRY